jgi:uncharacterized membrane protein
MVIRRIVGILAVVIILVGLAEIIFPDWATGLTRALMHPTSLRLTGVIGVAIGVVLLAAYAKRLVGLRLFVLILGIYVTVAGLFTFASPDFMDELVGVLFLNRRHSFQLTILWASGLLRIAIGCALLYAVARPPRPTVAGVS